MSKLVALIQTEERRGEGVVGDPIRMVTSYWTPEGEKVFEMDEWHPWRKERDALQKRLQSSEREIATLKGALHVADLEIQRQAILLSKARNHRKKGVKP